MTDRLPGLLIQLYAAEADAVRGRPEADFHRPTRTDWTVRELLFHQLLDAQRTLVALASPAVPGKEPDVDSVTYWRPFFPDSEWNQPHAEFVRVAASAYPSGAVLVDHFATTVDAAGRAVAAADPASRVRTQGHVITVADLASTLVVEATTHLLDLTVDLAGAPRPPVAALAEARRVLEGLNGAPLPDRWDDVEAVLKGTGRSPLTTRERAVLGDEWRPLLG
ncbi:MAG TPA: maleylpyruvate isomerase N-terminal domain-containing protein [Nocardioides sp.]|uniref:maleylpyruvate isomerase N-terminal domain-containing protein n=1 Tax=Nocardioides sp. TaxID=35761 RepID=UPI002E365A9E|nr:maleylpyruvate isomerase N-terminal domain-containing protein [Nocardioides sp.]HEX5090156.1 maleylpyruvate isomerase N-terminal domain-containing protein [Nocardioides sp.]